MNGKDSFSLSNVKDLAEFLTDSVSPCVDRTRLAPRQISFRWTVDGRNSIIGIPHSRGAGRSRLVMKQSNQRR